MERLSWLGRDGPGPRTRLGRLYAKKGRPRQAEREFRHSLALHPTIDAWRSLGLLGEEARDWGAVVRAYDGLLELDPEDGQVLWADQ